MHLSNSTNADREWGRLSRDAGTMGASVLTGVALGRGAIFHSYSHLTSAGIKTNRNLTRIKGIHRLIDIGGPLLQNCIPSPTQLPPLPTHFCQNSPQISNNPIDSFFSPLFPIPICVAFNFYCCRFEEGTPSSFYVLYSIRNKWVRARRKFSSHEISRRFSDFVDLNQSWRGFFGPRWRGRRMTARRIMPLPTQLAPGETKCHKRTRLNNKTKWHLLYLNVLNRII